MKSAADLIMGVWTAPEVPLLVEYPLEIMEDLRALVCDEIQQLSRAGADAAGVLFGVSRGPAIRILAWRPIGRVTGDDQSARLSRNDRAEMVRVLGGAASDPAMRGFEPLGWFVSHVDGGRGITGADVELFNNFFPHSWQVTLLLRRGTGGTARAGFFVREPDGFLRPDASYRELLIQPVRRMPGASVPKPPAGTPLRETARPVAKVQPATPAAASGPDETPPPIVVAVHEMAPPAPAHSLRDAEIGPPSVSPSQEIPRAHTPVQPDSLAGVPSPDPLPGAAPALVVTPLQETAPPPSPDDKPADVPAVPPSPARVASPDPLPGAAPARVATPPPETAPPPPHHAKPAHFTAVPPSREIPRTHAVVQPESAPETPAATVAPIQETAPLWPDAKPTHFMPAPKRDPDPAPLTRPPTPAETVRSGQTASLWPVTPNKIAPPPAIQPPRASSASPFVIDAAVSETPSFTLQAHSFGGSAWLWLISVLVVLAGIGFLVMQKRTPAPAPSFSLRLGTVGDSVEISWDRDSIPVRNGEYASLQIQYGSNTKQISLSSGELHAGSAVYVREPGDVAVQMTIYGSGREFHEFARLVTRPAVSAPSPRPSPEPQAGTGQLRTERDNLQTQVQALKEQIRKEASRADQAEDVVRILENRLKVDAGRRTPEEKK